MRVRSCPARPTKGLACLSSSSPGPSPTTRRRARAARAEGDVGPALAQLAARAALQRALLLAEGVVGIGEGRARQGDRPEAEVAMVAEGLGEVVQAVGERFPR